MSKQRSSLGRAAAIAVACACAGSGTAGAQAPGVIRGIVNGSGAPVPAAVVRVLGQGKGAETGADGRYLIAGVAPGTYQLVIQALGFKTVRRPVVVPAGDTVTVDAELATDAVLLADVVVSVSREAQSRATATSSIGVVDQAELERLRPHHPADVMSRIPGAWVSNLSGEGHMTAIRQPITTKPVYAFLEDGVPIRSTGFFNHNAMYEINVPMAERVEVIKGPGSALYGSDAIGGVISSFTRGPSEQASGQIFIEGGRFGYGRALATASDTWGNDGLRADLNLTRSDSYRDGAPYSRQSGTLRWDHRFERSTLKTIVAVSHIDQPGDGGGDLPEADYDARPHVNYTPVAFRRVLSVRASTAFERQGELSHLSGTVYGRYNELDLLPSWQLSFDPQVWESRNSSVGFLGRYRRTVVPLRSNVSVGVDLEASPGSRLERGIDVEQSGGVFESYQPGEVQYDYDVTFWQASPYLQLETTPLAGLRIDAGLRLDYVGFDYDSRLAPLATGSHRRPASTDVSYRRLSPKIGAAFEVVAGVNLFASYRAAFRAPSESQLFRQGSAVSTVDLEPVKADNYEVGARAALGSDFSVEATAYQLDIEDDILTFFDPGTGLRTASNAGATRHRGVELGLSARPLAAVRLDASWAFTKQEYREWRPNPTTDLGGNEIEVAPRDMGRVGVTFTPRLLGAGNLAAEWVHLGQYWMDPQNTERYAGHDVFNLSGTVPVTAQLELVGRLQNVTDVRFAETSSYTALQGRRYRPGPPRTFFLGAQYRFGAVR